MKTPIQELIDSVGNMAQGLDADELYDYFMEKATQMLEKEKEAMERYKALLEVTNEPDVEAWERKMKKRAVEFAEFWEAEGEYRESYYLDAEDAYNEKYESDE